ncbi:MAG: hypothetical protein ACTSUE_03025 [Promethearchaeota archaeon]
MDEKENNKSARDMVALKKVKTRGQRVNLSDGEIEMMRKFEGQVNPKADLSNDEITLMNVLEKQKLFLNRIAIMINQTRAALSLDLFMKKDLIGIINSLSAKGLVTSRDTPSGELVYYLTEDGKDFLGLI